MKNKITYFILLLITILILSACSNTNNNDIGPILYNFKEPTTFPIEVTDVSTEIDIQKVDFLHQFIFHYYNAETTQRIKYIVSKALDKDSEVSKNDKIEYKLENGILAYYSESDTSQSLWWVQENGFLARFVYLISSNTNRDFSEYKLEVEDLVELANQVQ